MDKSSVRKIHFVTIAGLIVNLILAALKGIGGLFFCSQALVADAIHSLSDLITDFAVIFGVKYWSAPPDDTHPYGHAKIETIVSFFIGFVLISVAAGLMIDAVGSLRSQVEKPPAAIAFWIAVISITSKEWLYRWTKCKATELKSSALAANAWHHCSDAISSIPVGVAIAISHWFPKWHFVDPLGAILVSGFIILAAWKIVKPALFELSESGSLSRQQEIRKIALKIPEICEVHAVRTRGVGTAFFTDLHVMVEPNLTVRHGHDIAHELKQQIINAGLGITDVIIHIEPYEKTQKN